jgi:hypothetical protein
MQNLTRISEFVITDDIRRFFEDTKVKAQKVPYISVVIAF